MMVSGRRYWNRLSLFGLAAIVLLPFVNPADGSSSPREDKSLPSGAVRISGDITRRMATALAPLLATGQVRELIVNSFGGDETSALQIAQQIRQRHIDIVVDGVCAGACASYIFVAGINRTLQPDSAVIFSDTSSSLIDLGAQDLKPGLSGYRDNDRQARQLYQLAGVDPTLLLQPQIEMATSCYGAPSLPGTPISYSSRFSGWVPTLDYLNAIGVRIGGHWPTTPDDFQRMWRKNFVGAHRRGSIAIGRNVQRAIASQAAAELHRIPRCGTTSGPTPL